MEYLSRALPSREGNRYALLSDDNDESEWRARGITPVWFSNESGDYSNLNDGIAKLADFVSRTQLGWKQELTALASSPPPQDEESEHQILDAIRNRNTARFFTNTAKDKNWPAWLDSKGALDYFFSGNELTEEQQQIALWLGKNYALPFAEELILLIGKHNLKPESVTSSVLQSHLAVP